MAFKFIHLEIPELIIVEPDIFKDNRGFFQEVYKKSYFKDNGISDEFNQTNLSFSKKNVIRGLHYQIEPYPQSKLVRCVKGKIFDVAVDVRKNSKTFGKWIGVELSDKNMKQFYLPYGFAHGFAVVSDYAIVEYLVSSEYSPNCERGIVYNDKLLNINWPVEFPIVSEKDLSLPSFEKAFYL